jgi:hypothetical protein
MWKNFFEAGGFGMYPTMVFGFLLVATAGLYALRGDPRFRQLAKTLGMMTFASGVLGTAVGVCNSVHYSLAQPREEQFAVLAMGCEESLHNLVLALIIMIIAGLVTSVGALRKPATGS